MIAIDFQGGAHGNYLEFACNKLAGITTDDSPFNKLGAAHKKVYVGERMFVSNHYSFFDIPLSTNKIISIQITEDDLLPLSQISLLRAGDYNYDNNKLEFNTYNKLNNVNYRWVLDKILSAYFINQIATSYDAVKDTTWPSVTTLSDFEKLPDHIREECINEHQLVLLELSADHPHCPRYILRDFFQEGFSNTATHGFITQQHKMKYSDDKDVYIFPYNCFYDTDKFIDHIVKINKWSGLNSNNVTDLLPLHNEFLLRQPFRDSKIKCDNIIAELLTTPHKILEDVTLLEESYINAKLKKSGHECRY